MGITTMHNLIPGTKPIISSRNVLSGLTMGSLEINGGPNNYSLVIDGKVTDKFDEVLSYDVRSDAAYLLHIEDDGERFLLTPQGRFSANKVQKTGFVGERSFWIRDSVKEDIPHVFVAGKEIAHELHFVEDVLDSEVPTLIGQKFERNGESSHYFSHNVFDQGPFTTTPLVTVHYGKPLVIGQRKEKNYLELWHGDRDWTILSCNALKKVCNPPSIEGLAPQINCVLQEPNGNNRPLIFTDEPFLGAPSQHSIEDVMLVCEVKFTVENTATYMRMLADGKPIPGKFSSLTRLGYDVVLGSPTFEGTSRWRHRPVSGRIVHRLEELFNPGWVLHYYNS